MSKTGSSRPASQSSSIRPISSSAQLSLESKLLASAINLPLEYSIIYVQFTPQSSAQNHQDIDYARRLVLEQNIGLSVLESLLPFAQILKGESCLWIFAIDTCVPAEKGKESIRLRIESMTFEGFTKSSIQYFRYRDIYPCSSACSSQDEPCPTCLEAWNVKSLVSNDHIASSISPAQSLSNFTTVRSSYSLPRRSLRRPYSFFLNAVRNRVIDDICEHMCSSDASIARRLQNGVLYGFPRSHGNWGEGWEHHEYSRTLVYCLIETTLYSRGILVQPQFYPTSFLPVIASVPLVPGTPINLLPFSTPAYFLNLYFGPTSALIKQFRIYLSGLGCGKWWTKEQVHLNGNDTAPRAQFILAWVDVQNKQGGEKGLLVIWPAALCLSLESVSKCDSDGNNHTCFAYERKPLSYIPELPSALQASPVPASATVTVQHTSSPDLTGLPAVSPVGARVSSYAASPVTPSQSNFPNRMRYNILASKPRCSFATETVQFYRALASPHVPPHDLRTIAVGVGKYVDAVAKVRERERERMRRERDAAATGQALKTNPVAVSNANHSVVESNATSSSMILSQSPVTSLATATQPLLFTPLTQPQHPPPASHSSYPSPPDDVVKSGWLLSVQDGDLDMNPMREVERASSIPSGSLGSVSNSNSFVSSMEVDEPSQSAIPSAEQMGSAVNNINLDLNSFGAFTDDDFSYFDDPNCTSTGFASEAPIGQTFLSNSTLGDEDVMSSFAPLFDTDLPASALSPSGREAWVPSEFAAMLGLKDETSLRTVSGCTEPELIPPSPEHTNTSQSGPPTPDVLYVPNGDTFSQNFSDKRGSELFTSIPFSSEFKAVDGKYSIGKFSIPSPPANEDPIEFSPRTLRMKETYASLTDPRVGVMQKLIGARRKTEHCNREYSEESPSSSQGHHDWIDLDNGQDAFSDSCSELESDEEVYMDEDDNMTISRPSTPLPPHVPPGPTLLATQFAHFILLPLSVNLRPHAHAFTGVDVLSPNPNHAPTPVSPAAVLGVTNENMGSLEASLQILCRELIENIIWREAWRAKSFDIARVRKHGNRDKADGTHPDHRIYQCFSSLMGLLDIRGYCQFVSISVEQAGREDLRLVTLQPPLLSVGKADSIVQLLPSALRFKEKLGLFPRSGPKDVTCFVLLDRREDIQRAEAWLSCISSIYSARGYGSHRPGSTRASDKDGIVLVQMDSFRKVLSSILSSIDLITSTVLFYVVTPLAALSIRSPFLRQVFSSIKRVLSDHEQDRILFHFIPDSVLFSSTDCSANNTLGIIIDGVYNRILRPVDRLVSSAPSFQKEKSRKYFEAPAFTLANTLPFATSLRFTYPPPSQIPLDRPTLLHVGYKVMGHGRLLAAACIDQRAECHDMSIWVLDSDHDEKQIIAKVWEFASKFTKRVSADWCIVITKLDSFCESELEGWTKHLETAPGPSAPLHVCICNVEIDRGSLSIAQNSPPRQLTLHGDSLAKGQIHSLSTVGHTVSTFIQCPLSPTFHPGLHASAMYISEDYTVHQPEGDRMRPLHSALLVREMQDANRGHLHTVNIHLLLVIKSPESMSTKVDEDNLRDIVKNFHELAILSQLRWQTNTSTILPYHLAALLVIDEILDYNDPVFE